MASRRRLSVYCLFAAAFSFRTAAAQRLCASINTADSGPSTNLYQSAGTCTTTCSGQYAYAVLQGNQCWCSNYTPDASTQSDGCNSPCPGYPDDMCGGGTSRYSYISLKQDLVLGTKGSKAQSASKTNPSSASEAQSTPILLSSTLLPPSSTSLPTSPSSSSSTSTSTSTPSSASPSSSLTSTSIVEAGAPIFLPVTTTIGGTIATVTVFPSQIVSSASPQQILTADSGIKKSTVVGIVLGCIAAAAFIVSLVFFLLYRRRLKERRSKEINERAGAPGSDWRELYSSSKDPFAEATISPISQQMYAQRDWSGSIESIQPRTDQCLRITNPDPPEKAIV